MTPTLRILDAHPARDAIGRRATIVRVGPADGIYRVRHLRYGPVADLCLLPHQIATWQALTSAVRDRIGTEFRVLRPAPGDVPGLPPEALS